MNLTTIGIHSLPILVIIVGAIIIYRLLKKLLLQIENRQQENVDRTKFNFLKNSIGVIISTIATILIIYSIPQLKSLGTALFAGAGIFAAIVGFASQAAFSNIISGVFIVIFKPFRVGDRIEISATQQGIVENITFRHTVIQNFEHRRIVIPNSIISNQTITNSSLEEAHIRKHLNFNISYTTNIDTVFNIIREEIEQHPLCWDRRSEEEKTNGTPVVDVKVIAWADTVINLKAYVWTKNSADAFELSCDVLKSVKERFEQAGIEMPYPHRVIINKNGQ